MATQRRPTADGNGKVTLALLSRDMDYLRERADANQATIESLVTKHDEIEQALWNLAVEARKYEEFRKTFSRVMWLLITPVLVVIVPTLLGLLARAGAFGK